MAPFFDYSWIFVIFLNHLVNVIIFSFSIKSQYLYPFLWCKSPAFLHQKSLHWYTYFNHHGVFMDHIRNVQCYRDSCNRIVFFPQIYSNQQAETQLMVQHLFGWLLLYQHDVIFNLLQWKSVQSFLERPSHILLNFSSGLSFFLHIAICL